MLSCAQVATHMLHVDSRIRSLKKILHICHILHSPTGAGFKKSYMDPTSYLHGSYTRITVGDSVDIGIHGERCKTDT